MKKIILLVTFIVMNCLFVNAQNLSNWKHFYSELYFNEVDGNNYYAYNSGELILFNKSSYSYTRVPVPPFFRTLNPHNTIVSNYIYPPNVYPGPDNKLLIRSDLYPNCFIYDGFNWSPITSYQGKNISTLRFLPNVGGSNFFTDSANLYQFNGSTLTTFTTFNSFFDPQKYYYQKTNAFDDIFLMSSYDMAIFNGLAWTRYDTTFFHTHYYLNFNANDISVAGNFSFYNPNDTALHSYNRVTDTWSKIGMPASMLHGAYSSVYNLWYNSIGEIWLYGNGVYCRYDGTQFYDYYTSYNATFGSTSFSLYKLSGDNVLLKEYKNHGVYRVYNPITNSVSTVNDPQEKLTGDLLLPSCKDKLGNLFFGATDWSLQNGLMKFDGSQWTYPNLYGNNVSGKIYSIAQDTGNAILIGTDYSSNYEGPVRLDDTTFTFINNQSNFHMTRDFAVDKNMHYWYGGDGSGLLAGLTEFYNGTVINNYIPTANPTGSVYTVAVDSASNVWVGFDSFDGVHKLVGGNLVNFNHQNSALPNDTVVEIQVEPHRNAIWFSTSNGFAKLYHNTWTIYNTSNTPLPSNDAEYVYFADDSTIWFATMNGLAGVKNNVWKVYTVNNSPMFQNDIESMVIDNNCRMWMCTDGTLMSAALDCGATSNKIVNGTVMQSNSTAAANALIYIFKRNAIGTDVSQVENTFTDTQGHFIYFPSDTGQYYFMVESNPVLFTGQMPSYEDSALVIQQATKLNVTSNGNFPVSLKMRQAIPASGALTLYGQLQSSSERIGNVRLLLMLNNQAVASTYSSAEGVFHFRNIAAGSYAIWVDKMGLNNLVAPVVSVSGGAGSSGASELFFNLYPTYLSLSPLSATQNDLNLQVSVYPNPANDILTIAITNQNVKQIFVEIKDIVGNTVYSNKCAFALRKSIDVSNLKNGIYILEMSVNGERIVRKIVKE